MPIVIKHNAVSVVDIVLGRLGSLPDPMVVVRIVPDRRRYAIAYMWFPIKVVHHCDF